MRKLSLSILMMFLGTFFIHSSTTKIQKFNITSNKTIVVINTASWCPACIKNKDKISTKIIPNYQNDSNFIIVMNNLSDKNSKKESLEILKKNGIEKTMKKKTGTGIIYFINQSDGKISSKISVTETEEKILNEFNKYKK